MSGPSPSPYDPVAGLYAKKYSAELDDKPFDRQQLDAFAATVRPGGLVADLGCGPGHVGRYLAGKGLVVAGFDLSDGMLAEARRANPGIRYEQVDLLELRAIPHGWAGAVAAYSLIHIPQPRLAAVLGSIRAGLEPGAPLLASFHQGSGMSHVESLLGEPVSVDFYFYGKDEVLAAFGAAGFGILTVAERESYPGIEMQTRRRLYVLGRA